MSSAESPFVVCGDRQLADLIDAAAHRVVVVAPAVNEAVADAVTRAWDRLGPGAVVVILDSDPEVYHIGFGQPEALATLANGAERTGAVLQRQPGLRIGLVIADEETLVFVPTPQSIEAGPNTAGGGVTAVRLSAPPAAVLSGIAGASSEPGDTQIGRGVLDGTIAKGIQDAIKANPPKRFDVARTERVFNAAFEFVEFELLGVAIDRKRVRIPNEFLGLARDEQTKRLMDTTFRLVDESESLSGRWVHELKAQIVKECLTNLPGYGTVVLRAARPHFERRVRVLRRAVAWFSRKVTDKLQQAMDRNREALVKALLPSVVKAPPKSWQRYGPLTPAQVEQILSSELKGVFGEVSDLVGEMQVKTVYKGVTYQSLTDPRFQELVRERLPFLSAAHEEHVSAPEVRPEAATARLFD